MQYTSPTYRLITIWNTGETIMCHIQKICDTILKPKSSAVSIKFYAFYASRSAVCFDEGNCWIKGVISTQLPRRTVFLIWRVSVWRKSLWIFCVLEEHKVHWCLNTTTFGQLHRKTAYFFLFSMTMVFCKMLSPCPTWDHVKWPQT